MWHTVARWQRCEVSPERRRTPRVVLAGAVADVAHRRGDVGVAEHGLYVRERERLDRGRAERMAQILKADAGETGILQRPVVAPSQQGVVLDLADLIGSTEIVGTSELLTLPEPRQRGRDLGDHRPRATPRPRPPTI
jgi:hypothetical protein